MATRKFSFPLSVLLGSSRRLYDALTDPDYATAMAERLNGPTDMPTDNFATRFEAKIAAFSTGQSTQNAQTGAAGTLTKEQKADLLEMERLVAGARRSARLAFPDDPVKLHSEFQVGITDPATLDAELERAGIIVTSCQDADNAVALKAQGWTAADTTLLNAAVGKFSGTALERDEAFDDRIGPDRTEGRRRQCGVCGYIAHPERRAIAVSGEPARHGNRPRPFPVGYLPAPRPLRTLRRHADAAYTG